MVLATNTIVDRINQLHDKVVESAISAVQYAKECGLLLIAAKLEVDHGYWLDWVRQNTNVPVRTAQMYMRVAREWDTIVDKNATVAHLTLRDAVKTLTTAEENISRGGAQEWYTPKDDIALVRKVLGKIDLDPASSAEANGVVGASVYYTRQDDGLTLPWHGKVFMNPPYGTLAPKFIAKLFEEPVEEAILYLNLASMDAKWFCLLWDNGTICIPRHRAKFWQPGKPDWDQVAPTGRVFVYIGPHPYNFVDVFSKVGTIVKKAPGDKQEFDYWFG